MTYPSSSSIHLVYVVRRNPFGRLMLVRVKPGKRLNAQTT